MIYIPLAHRLNDNDPWTLVSAANCYAFCGQDKEAAEIIDSMLRENATIAPSALQWAYHTAVRFMIADYEGCVAAADFAGDLNPNVPGFKAAALWHLGREEQAAAELDRFFTVVRSLVRAGTGDSGCDDPLVSSTLPDRKTGELGTPARWNRGRRRPGRRPAPSSVVNLPRNTALTRNFEWNSRRYERHAGLIAAF
jgi:tetratricopeptide (TPR) repeat protein